MTKLVTRQMTDEERQHYESLPRRKQYTSRKLHAAAKQRRNNDQYRRTGQSPTGKMRWHSM